jgi:alkanesulfonate monooxygenase SsuD/methylene tetrahydromethanopterin reductase-like flavin-dependent oxidoreductase (luciferase family)
VRRYRERVVGPGKVALPSHVFVARDPIQARRVWRPNLAAYADFARPWRGDDSPVDIDELMDGAAVCGDPEEVAARLDALAAMLGLDAHLALIDIGGLSGPQVLDAIRLFGTEVIPRLGRRVAA